jgi:hypothetical protein
LPHFFQKCFLPHFFQKCFLPHFFPKVYIRRYEQPNEKRLCQRLYQSQTTECDLYRY